MYEIKLKDDSEIKKVLSPAEVSVFRQWINSRTYKQIALETDISENTVKFHVRNILQKTTFRDAKEAAIDMIFKGWAEIKATGVKGMFILFISISSSFTSTSKNIGPSKIKSNVAHMSVRARGNYHA